MGLRLVVGLGNPGSRYARTRHNVGFRLVEHLAGGEASWRDFGDAGRYCQAGGLIYAEPLTYMNESGRFVQAFSRYYKISPAEMLICFDEVALPLGRLRLRPSGSAGGQRGMESVISCLGTQDVPRLRLGVGPQPAGMDSARFVLSRFSAGEQKTLGEVLETAADAVAAVAGSDLEAAMNRYNAAA